MTGPKSRLWKGEAFAIDKARDMSPTALAKKCILLIHQKRRKAEVVVCLCVKAVSERVTGTT